jgi:hypothetical protein
MNKLDSGFLNFLRIFVESFAIILGLAYTVGLVVVNSYLYQYGAIEFELFKTRYISCGILVLVLIFIIASGSLPRIMIPPSKNKSLS